MRQPTVTKAFFSLALLGLVMQGAQGCGGTAPRSQAEMEAPGPYAVATEDLMLVDASRPTPKNGTYPGAAMRTLRTRVHYPAPGSGPGAGPFPLIAYAHGFMSSGQMGAAFAEHLASHGYVVAAPDFPLSTLQAPGGPTLLDMGSQPGDLAFVLSRVAEMAKFSPDPQRRGVLGLSLGGGTALLSVYHPALRVEGIGAAVVQAPLSCLFGPAFYGRAAKVMVMTGDADQIVPIGQGPRAIFERAPGGVDLLVLRGGNHIGFVGLEKGQGMNNADDLGCQLLSGPGAGDLLSQLAGQLAAGAPTGALDASGCGQQICAQRFPQTMTAERQMTLSRAATLAYFEQVLRADPGAERFLSEVLAAQNADVTYQRKP